MVIVGPGHGLQPSRQTAPTASRAALRRLVWHCRSGVLTSAPRSSSIHSTSGRRVRDIEPNSCQNPVRRDIRGTRTCIEPGKSNGRHKRSALLACAPWPPFVLKAKFGRRSFPAVAIIANTYSMVLSSVPGICRRHNPNVRRPASKQSVVSGLGRCGLPEANRTLCDHRSITSEIMRLGPAGTSQIPPKRATCVTVWRTMMYQSLGPTCA